MLKIGDIIIDAPIYIAPMSGVSDAAFRKQAQKFGAPAIVTEMIAGHELVKARHIDIRRLERMHDADISNTARPGHRSPFIVQLAGREAKWMQKGAALCRDAGAQIIDINMGCPSKKVTGGQSGCALMRDLDLAEQLISAVLEGANGIPVTLKMRLGWDDNSLNAPELAMRAERLGVKLLTVHGRTRNQFYKGYANWHAIRNVVEAVNIPVIANGDIHDVTSARDCLESSGAAGIMVGRASIGQPWLIRQIAHELYGLPFDKPDISCQRSALFEQIEDSMRLYGDGLGLRIVRKHIAAFIDRALENLRSERQFPSPRNKICSLDSPKTLMKALDQFYLKLEAIQA